MLAVINISVDNAVNPATCDFVDSVLNEDTRKYQGEPCPNEATALLVWTVSRVVAEAFCDRHFHIWAATHTDHIEPMLALCDHTL